MNVPVHIFSPLALIYLFDKSLKMEMQGEKWIIEGKELTIGLESCFHTPLGNHLQYILQQ